VVSVTIDTSSGAQTGAIDCSIDCSIDSDLCSVRTVLQRIREPFQDASATGIPPRTACRPSPGSPHTPQRMSTRNQIIGSRGDANAGPRLSVRRHSARRSGICQLSITKMSSAAMIDMGQADQRLRYGAGRWTSTKILLTFARVPPLSRPPVTP